ncbi:MAG TPA: MOSC domain-containing protein [Gemmatimonadales bacterium]|nr:MOSC domain-containing protein [Gemmatimonadales bacterium]
MLLESIQVGQPRTVGRAEAEDQLDRAFTSAIWKEPVEGPVWLDTLGLQGDRQADRRHHGGPWRALLMYSAEHYPLWRAEWGRKDLPHGAFGENLTVSGLTEQVVCLGDQFEIGEALIEVTSPRSPCHVLAKRHGIRDLVETIRANHRHGWYLRVLRAGWIEAGQPIALRDRPYPQWPIVRAAEVRWQAGRNPEEAALLAACPALIPEWRESLAAR